MRKRVDFWLDDTHTQDVKLWKIIQKLRGKRAFSQTVKDGILIVNQLRQGKLDALLRLHPWIVDKILTTYAPPPSATDTGDLEARITARIDSALQEALLHAPSLPATTPVASGTIGQGKTFTLPLVDDSDDDDDTIVLKKSTGTNSTRNFLASFAKLGL